MTQKFEDSWKGKILGITVIIAVLFIVHFAISNWPEPREPLWVSESILSDMEVENSFLKEIEIVQIPVNITVTGMDVDFAEEQVSRVQKITDERNRILKDGIYDFEEKRQWYENALNRQDWDECEKSFKEKAREIMMPSIYQDEAKLQEAKRILLDVQNRREEDAKQTK